MIHKKSTVEEYISYKLISIQKAFYRFSASSLCKKKRHCGKALYSGKKSVRLTTAQSNMVPRHQNETISKACN